MSRRITAGNDAPFRWAVKLQGKPFDLSGKDVKVYVINSRGEIPVARLTIEGNEVSGVFEGRYQTRLGEHSLILRVNEGRPEMKTAAVANVFELVQWSADAGGSDEGDVIVAPIVVESEITAGILAEYTKKDEFDSAVQTLSDQLEQKVNMEEGKGLSSNDFTNALKAKLESLSNYDDQELREAINAIESTIDTLIGDNASKKIESFNEIIRFLEGVEDTESLAGIVAGIQQSIAKKADASVVVSLAEEVQTLKTEVESQNELIEDLQNTKIDKEADDYYPQLSVGLADNLAGVDVVNSEVNFRRSGGGVISDGVARIEAIKGNSVVWNQQSSSETLGNGVNLMPLPLGATIVEGNKYLILCDLECSLYLYYNKGEGNKSVTSIYNKSSLFFTSSVSCTSNGKHSEEGGLWWYLTVAIDAPFHARLIDLTKAFPNDWQNINTIEDFYARIPMGVDLNAYNEGEVIHMDVQSIESQGVNAWDEELEIGRWNIDTLQWEKDSRYLKSKNFFSILPNTQYRITNPSGTISRYVYYDKDKQYISYVSANSNSIFTTPSNACYMMFGLGSAYKLPYNHDICINISDTSINGKYFPYVKRTEDLSIIRKYFPQGMKSAGSAHDEIRYNKVTQKWEYSKERFKSVDLGTFNWRLSGGVRMVAPGGFASASYNSNVNISNILTKKYMTLPYNSESQPSVYKGDTGIALFKDGEEYYLSVYDTAYTDAASFKDAMQGVILYYESNDWEWVELDAEDQFKDLDYQVWNCGTEKAIAEGKSAPLAADITYGFNAIGKIKELESLVAALRAKVGI